MPGLKGIGAGHDPAIGVEKLVAGDIERGFVLPGKAAGAILTGGAAPQGYGDIAQLQSFGQEVKFRQVSVMSVCAAEKRQKYLAASRRQDLSRPPISLVCQYSMADSAFARRPLSLHEFHESSGCYDKTIRGRQAQTIADIAEIGHFRAGLFIQFMAEFAERYDELAGSENMPSGQFLLDCLMNVFAGEKEFGILMLVEDAEIGNQLEDQISKLFRCFLNIMAVKNILAPQFVTHVGHEFQNPVVPLQDALKFLKEHRKGQHLFWRTPEGEQVFQTVDA